MSQPLATSSRGTIPPHKLQVVRDPSVRVRQAVRDNNVPLLNRLQHKTDLRNTDRVRLTSLSWAALEGSLEVFEWLLLDYGHDDQELSRDADNNTILHLLAAIPSLSVSPHTRLLLSSPAFPPRPSSVPMATQSAISLRMTLLYHTLFPFLLDWSNSGGKTALHVAAQAGNAAFINLLCDLGADVDLTDLQGNTPLHYASAWGHLETVRVLLERGCQFAARNAEGFTASDFAYSDRVMSGLQTIAREVFESRRSRRKDERLEARAQSQSSAPGGSGGRIRSGSVSTSNSMGSGAGSSTNLTNNYGYISQPTYPQGANVPAPLYGERTSSLPMMRRGSDSQTTNTSTSASNSNSNLSLPALMARPKQLQQSMGPPPLPPPLPAIQTNITIPPQQRYPSPTQPPQPYRSPSMPAPSSGSIAGIRSSPKFTPAQDPPPPLPTPPEGALMGSVMRRANSAQAGTGVNIESRR